MHLCSERAGQKLVEQLDSKIPLGNVFDAALVQESGERGKTEIRLRGMPGRRK